jgi:hypothetical protein
MFRFGKDHRGGADYMNVILGRKKFPAKLHISLNLLVEKDPYKHYAQIILGSKSHW